MFPSWKSNRKTKFSLIILKQKINPFPQMVLSWKTGKKLIIDLLSSIG